MRDKRKNKKHYVKGDPLSPEAEEEHAMYEKEEDLWKEWSIGGNRLKLHRPKKGGLTP